MAEVDLARAKEIFGEALERQGAERTAYLDAACADDPAMRSRVEVLLRAAELDDPFLSDATIDSQSSSPADEPLLISGPASTPSEKPGGRIGPYRLLQQIGEGGFGVVFMAEQEHPVRRRVALKIIKLGMDTRAVVARFEQERQALAVLDHPHIAKVLDAGATDTGRPYFVMELVKGEPITEYCDSRSLTIRDRLELFAQICNAVQHAHTKGIIHRDLKPTNVLVSEVDGRASAKVIDFGIAKATEHRLTEKTLFTEFQQIIGTPEYMSPEQAGGSLDIDTRSDVYSLGVLLYELVTGTTPFDARKLRSAAYGELQRIIREVDPPRPSTRLSESADTIARVAARRRVEPRRLGVLVRGELDWIVMKAMEKDRARRYETPNNLAADVLRHLSGQAVSAAPPTALYRLRKFVRRHRTGVVAGSLIALALTAGAVAALIGLFEARAAGERERAQAEAARRQAAIAQAANTFLTDMLAKADPGEQGGNADLTVRQVLDVTAHDLRRGAASYEPEVLSSVHETIGKTYRGIGLYSDAENHLREALRITEEVHGLKHPRTAAAMRTLAEMLYLADHIDEGESLARRAAALDTELFGPDHAAVAQDRTVIGLALQARRDYLGAEKEFNDSLAILRQTPEDHPEDIAGVLTNLALVLQSKGDIDGSEKMYREALAIHRKIDGAESPRIATILNNIAWILNLKKDFDGADAMYHDVIDMRRRLFKDDHPLLATSINNYGGMLQARGDFVNAEKAFREALDIRRRAYTDEHPKTIGSIENLGSLLIDQGKLDEGEALLRQSLALRRKVLGDNDPDVADSLGNLASLMLTRGKFPEGEQLFREALAIRRTVAQGPHPDTAISLISLAVTLSRQEKYPEAIELVREALDMRRALTSPTDNANVELTMAKGNLGIVLTSAGRYAEAVPALREALADSTRVLTPQHPRTIACMGTLGNALNELAWLDRTAPTALQNATEAEQLLRETLRIRLQNTPPGAAVDPTTASTQLTLATAIVTRVACAAASPQPPDPAVAVQSLEEAQSLFEKAYEIIAAGPTAAPADVSRIRIAGERRARLHDVWDTIEPDKGHAEKAVQWRAKHPRTPPAP